MEWYLTVLKKYADFSGRARRMEFWMYSLISFIIVVVLTGIDVVILGTPLLSWLYAIAVFIPNLAVTVRRLHDTGRSGWWFLIVFVPLIGPIVLLIFMLMDSQPGTNAYGPNPKGVAA